MRSASVRSGSDPSWVKPLPPPLPMASWNSYGMMALGASKFIKGPFVDPFPSASSLSLVMGKVVFRLGERPPADRIPGL
ncbi:hypothetical protein DPMN_097575 [Dreissena polymorpha]|uniref:Uncharacterized protein n=1 Tax=Dreissena polymorpha TaxID=45954 RepID=A0A9D4R6H6_DREPO|nr:hypothetical protein DPMN_097575 [Dreissena polymorpha]